MSVLLLRLAGPLQSWSDSSRFGRRETRAEPTKSGLLGLVAAAQGRLRTDPIEDLLALRYAVRIDQPGELVRDYQTARNPSWPNAKLSTRYYLGDAVFLAALEADRSVIDGIAEAIASPAFPLYLGRRSCPPAAPLLLGVSEGDLHTVISAEPWHASPWYQKRSQSPTVSLELYRDVGEADSERDQRTTTIRDVPLSFSQERREYGWRTVVAESVSVENPRYGTSHDRAGGREVSHDVWSSVGGL